MYPELSYQLIGMMFDVGVSLGFGHKEKFYQKALSQLFKENNLKFKEQLPCKLYFKEKFIGIYYFDFLIEDKIILEIKSKNFFSKQDIEQLYNYLKVQKLKLGIIAHFTRDQVKFKRVVNL